MYQKIKPEMTITRIEMNEKRNYFNWMTFDPSKESQIECLPGVCYLVHLSTGVKNTSLIVT